MNERIKELMAQAGFDPAAIERMGVMPQAEKFAELLIQECANIDYKNASDGEFSNDDSYLISKVIKQHFGAEE